MASGSGDDMIMCPERGEEKWYIFFVTSVLVYLVGLGGCSLLYLAYWAWNKLVERESDNRHPGIKCQAPVHLGKIQEYIRKHISGDTIASKIILLVTFICNVIYIILTIYRTYFPVEQCFVLSESPNFIVELVVVIILIVYSLLRLLSAENIVKYWFSAYTLVDAFTLPNIFVSITLGVDYLGLRALRFIYLTQLVTLIRYLPFNSQDAIDIISLLINFIILWLTFSGVIHLLEAQGDPWRGFENARSTSFLEYTYFMMVTISTVGYGDYFAMSDWGRFIMVFFILMGLAFFASVLPALADVTSSYYQRTQFARFDTTRVPQHVIVCGHITAFTATEFLKDFLHPDRGDTNTHVLFLHPERPNPELKNVIRSNYSRVQYLVGSVLNTRDLQKSQIEKSQACFIIADKHCENPIEEDNANLLRLVSVKNTTTKVAVIVQLIHSTSKEQVKNIEGWHEDRDIALCLNELKLGLLAQSCMSPGFSTLIANLFYTSDFPLLKSFDTSNAWKEHYIKGASNEIYSCKLSHSFEGQTFHTVARRCYNKLGLVLLALESQTGSRKLYVNPSPNDYPHLKVKPGMYGYFIGQDQAHVEIASVFCEQCHHQAQLTHSEEVHRFVRKLSTKNCRCRKENNCLEGQELTDLSVVVVNEGTKKTLSTQESVSSSLSSSEDEYDAIKQEFSIYIQQPAALDKSILNPGSCDTLIDITVETSPRPELADHVVLCVFANENSPLLGLHNFIIPLRNRLLSESQIKPVVIVSNKRFLEREWKFICKLPDVSLVVGNPLRWQTLLEANITTCSVCVVLTMLSSDGGHEPAISDKEAVLCSLSIQKHLKNKLSHALVITDLRQESNVQFLDFGDEDEQDERIYKAQPFACGEAFSISMADSVTSSAFHTPGTLHLVEELINVSGKKAKCQVVTLPINKTEFVDKRFGDFYSAQLDKYTICLGLYRLLPNGKEDKHYVITTPVPTLLLKSTDIAFILMGRSSEPENDSKTE